MRPPSAHGHDRIEALIAVDALGGLDDADRRELERALESHGPDCPECRRLRTEYGETAARLALALEPEPLSRRAEERLLEGARQAGAGRRPVPGPQLDRTRDRRSASAIRVRPWQVAAAAALALLAGFVGYSLAPSGPAPTRVASLSGGRQVLQVAYRPGESAAIVVGTNIPAPPAGRVYQLWYLPEGATQMEPAGTFVPRDGVVAAPARVGPSFVKLAVSLEPVGGSAHPTRAPLYVTSA